MSKCKTNPAQGRTLQESQRIQSNTTSNFFIINPKTCFGPTAHHQVGKNFNVRETLNDLAHLKVPLSQVEGNTGLMCVNHALSQIGLSFKTAVFITEFQHERFKADTLKLSAEKVDVT